MSRDYWGDPFDGAPHPDRPEPVDTTDRPSTAELAADEGFDPADEATDYQGGRLGRRLGKGHWQR